MKTFTSDRKVMGEHVGAVTVSTLHGHKATGTCQRGLRWHVSCHENREGVLCDWRVTGAVNEGTFTARSHRTGFLTQVRVLDGQVVTHRVRRGFASWEVVTDTFQSVEGVDHPSFFRCAEFEAAQAELERRVEAARALRLAEEEAWRAAQERALATSPKLKMLRAQPKKGRGWEYAWNYALYAETRREFQWCEG